MSSAPITGVAFFTSFHRVPPSFTIIARTKDTHEDADLGKESLFRKSARYLGFEKAPFDPKSPPEVLVELMLINEKDSVRSGFQAIDKTYDTRERCLKRKILCARFEPWAPNLTAITDLLIFSRMGDHLTGRTYVGDLSSQAILACVQTVLSSPTDGIIPKRPAPKAGPYSLSGDMSSPIFQPMLNPLKGVPFELHAACRQNSQDGMKNLPVQPKAAEEVEQEFSYNFSLERSLVMAN
uniref:Multivesicular body subunit 12B n=1 Tax=Schistocephalus solidus TaxID=70667 RepID=A0A0X3PC04_SCHSO